MSSLPQESEHEFGDEKATYPSLVDSLRASEARYRELFENANDLVFTVDFDGTFTSMNRTAEDTTGFSRSELVGSDISVLVPPQYVERVREMMRHKITTRERTRYEIEIVAKDGRHIPIEIGSRLIYENGKAVGIQGIARDVSDRKKAEEQLKRTIAELERSNQELQLFAGVASHDMHAPLRRIAGFGRLLREKKSGQLDEEGREWIDFVVSGAEQMQQLIDDLLAYSRYGASWKPAERVDCKSAVQSAMGNLTDAVSESGAQLKTETLPVVMGDRVALVQLFQNLIENAIKYRSDDPPRIEISASRQDELWLFRIKDNGIGIAREHHERIFDAFRRLHSEDEYGGTGIGLATCKKIVERFGGQIWIESEIGLGAEFLFTLPAATSSQMN